MNKIGGVSYYYCEVVSVSDGYLEERCRGPGASRKWGRGGLVDWRRTVNGVGL